MERKLLQKYKIAYMKYADQINISSLLIKFFIFYTLFSITLVTSYFLIRDLDPSPKLKIYLKGFIINPEAFYIQAQKDKDSGRNKEGLLNIDLAIGLLKINNVSDKNYVNKFYTLRDELLKAETTILE